MVQKHEYSADITPSTSGVIIPFTKPITPPVFAEFLGCNVNKVLTWIHSGALTAVNVAAETSTRPRWRILPESAGAFLASRANTKPAKRTHRKKSASGAKDFF